MRVCVDDNSRSRVYYMSRASCDFSIYIALARIHTHNPDDSLEPAVSRIDTRKTDTRFFWNVDEFDTSVYTHITAKSERVYKNI